MQIDAMSDQDITFLKVDAERIDASVAIKFKDLMRQFSADTEGRLVLDLGKVDFIDSSGLGAIVAAMKLLPADRKLELAGLSPTVDKVFRMTRMDTIFQIHASAEAVMAAPQ